MAMKNNSYKFRYENKGQKICQMLKEAVKNFFTPIIICCFIFFCMGATNTAKYIPSELGGLMFDISVIIGIVMVLIYGVLCKGVILSDDHLEITTRSILNAGKKPKIKISYNEIANVTECVENIKSNKLKMKNAFLTGDCSDYVEITLKGGKQFCFSVENQEEFISELLSRMGKKEQSV